MKPNWRKSNQWRSGKDKARKPESAPPSALFEVGMTETCAKVYKELYKKSKDAERQNNYYTNSHCTTFEMMDVVKCVIPSDPLNKKVWNQTRACQHSPHTQGAYANLLDSLSPPARV